MQLNHHTVSSWLNMYTERESFYKKYFLCRNDKNAVQKLLSTLNLCSVEKNRIVLPEIYSPRYRTEKKQIIQNNLLSYFSLPLNISVEKHPRYIPEFVHGHTYFELMYVYQGKCTNTINNHCFNLSEGDIFIIAPQAKHSVSVFDDSIIINIKIKPQAVFAIFSNLMQAAVPLSKFFQNIISGNIYCPYIFLPLGNSVPLKKHIDSIVIEYFNNENFSENIIANYLNILFSLILRSDSNAIYLEEALKNDFPNIGKIICCIQENFKTITLSEMSSLFHYTPQYLSKIIKEYTGTNFIQTIQTLKLQYACQELLTTNHSIAVIAAESGYKNEAHFIRKFKQKFNITPLQYRKSKYSLYTKN